MPATTKEKNLPLSIATVGSIGVLVYVIAGQAHEALGHGGACLWLGGQPQALSLSYFTCNTTGISEAGRRFIQGAGVLSNLFVGLAAWSASPLFRKANGPLRYFLWLTLTVNLMMAGSYPIVLSIANHGDVHDLIRGASNPGLLRILIVGLGAAVTALSLYLSLRAGWLIGREAKQWSVLLRVTWFPYVLGALVFFLAGLRNRDGFIASFVIPLSFTLLGTAPLVLVPLLARWTNVIQSTPNVEIRRSWAWIASALVAASLFIILVGPTIRFSSGSGGPARQRSAPGAPSRGEKGGYPVEPASGVRWSARGAPGQEGERGIVSGRSLVLG